MKYSPGTVCFLVKFAIGALGIVGTLTSCNQGPEKEIQDEILTLKGNRVSLPMYFPPAPFNLENAVENATVVLHAYDMYDHWVQQDKPGSENFTWTPNIHALRTYKPLWADWTFLKVFREHEPFGFVASTDDGTVFVVFRGTKSLADWPIDFEGIQTPYSFVQNFGMVHEGYAMLYSAMRDEIADAIADIKEPKRLYLTGHSMGAALSTLAAPDILVNTHFSSEKISAFHYNFASPRVGDLTFSNSYNQMRVHTYRFVNVSDIVPNSVPPIFGDMFYEHVGIPVSYTANFGSVAKNHKMTAYHNALLNPSQPKKIGTPDTSESR